jgi:hypothetical protein
MYVVDHPLSRRTKDEPHEEKLWIVNVINVGRILKCCSAHSE